MTRPESSIHSAFTLREAYGTTERLRDDHPPLAYSIHGKHHGDKASSDVLTMVMQAGLDGDALHLEKNL